MKHIKLYEEFTLNEDWGSSDQAAMNKSMHKELGEPKEFPGLDAILSAAESAVDFYWDEWEEYKTQRDDLINNAGRRYMQAYFPDLFKGFMAMFNESHIQTDATEEITEAVSPERIAAHAKKIAEAKKNVMELLSNFVKVVSTETDPEKIEDAHEALDTLVTGYIDMMKTAP